MLMFRLLISAALLLATTTLGAAQDQWPLAAVGRVGTSFPGGCSATLIERDLVLTAAHCATKAVENPSDYIFTSGAYPGLPAITVRVAKAGLHPFYDLDLGRDVNRIRFDLALLRLEEPILNPAIIPIALSEGPAEGEDILLASYRGGIGNRARERKCEVFSTIRDAVAIGCDVQSGESGSPILQDTDQGLRVVAVLSSRAQLMRQPIGFAAPVLPRIVSVRDVLSAP